MGGVHGQNGQEWLSARMKPRRDVGHAVGVENLVRSSRALLIVATLVIVAVIGFADYLTGYEISFSVFYLIAVAFAAWFVSQWFAVLVSILSVVTGVVTDVAAGAQYRNPLIPAWNAAINLAFYLIVVWLLTRLRSFQQELEERVRQRTAALAGEMAERARLEKEILEISERERRAIGHDLHDSLGQHLTGTALAGQVLEDKLAAKTLAEAEDARRIVALVEAAIEITRSLSRGLHPMEMQADGLMTSLGELAAATSDHSPVRCRFECDPPVLVNDATTAMHLYRIAQEAVANACKHGKAKTIVIRLSPTRAGVELRIEDDGIGLRDPMPDTAGMGLRIMAHRASMIGGTFAVSRGADGGTAVSCTVP